MQDQGAIERLGRHGYLRDKGAPWLKLDHRPLREFEAPELPPGFRLRTATDVDPAAIVAVHRVAWHPSQFSLDSLRKVRSSWPYGDDLAVFVEAPNGSLVAYAIVWYHEINGTVELEPVGTDPDYRRQGLGRAVSLFGMHRARAAGATQAIVSCRADENYPIPQRLYRSVGFDELTRDLVFAK